MADTECLRTLLKRLFEAQALGVLATHGEGQPYTSLVGITASDDLACLWFATLRSAHKYANLSGDRRVALLVDSRTHRDTDFREAVAVTAIGVAEGLSGERAMAAARRHTARHPELADFVGQAGCVMVEVTVSRYVIVQQFQSVQELHMV